MTTKEIAEFNNVSTKTVRRWLDKMSKGAGQNAISAEKIKMIEAGEKGVTVDWTDDEVFAIMSAGGRSMVAEWMKNTKSNTSIETAPAIYNGKEKINFYLTQAVLELQKRDDEREQQIKSIVKVYGNRLAELSKKQKMLESPDTKYQIELARRINGFTQSELDRYLDELNGTHSYLYK